MSGRPSTDQVLMDTALLWATRSTCSRAHVGAVVSIDGRIISTGYNGSPAGLPHCTHWISHAVEGMSHSDRDQCPLGNPFCEQVMSAVCPYSVHAETNAVAFAARHGVRLEGSTLHTTHSPCVPCAQLIINSGIREVVYLNDYRITDGRRLLQKVDVEVRQLV